MSLINDNLIILAGGASSRMKRPSSNLNLTKEELEQSNQRSKGLISMNEEGRPFMDYLLFNAKQAGYRHIYLVINPKANLFKQLYGAQKEKNFFHGLTISYAYQYIPEYREKPLGTADAIFQTMEQFPELQSKAFTVCNCDNLYSITSLKALKTTNASNALIAYDREYLEFSTERIARFAVLKSKNGLLQDIVEKPQEDALENFKDNSGKIRISMNIFKFTGSETFQYFKECPLHPDRNEKEIPTVLMNFISDPKNKVVLIPLSEHVPDLTSKEDIPKLKEFINIHYGELNWETET